MTGIRKMMKRINKGALSAVAALALVVTTSNVNSVCWFVLGQEELPEGAKKLSRFK